MLHYTFGKHSKPVMTISAHPTKPWVRIDQNPENSSASLLQFLILCLRCCLVVQIASASRDGTCIVWDVERKKDVLTLSLPAEATGRGSICRSCA